VHDSAVRARELAMQAQLAEQRAAEAALEKQRVFHAEQTERVAAVQGRYYENGAQISRAEQSIQHTRELRERQRTDLAAAHGTLNDLALHIERDERELGVLRAELAELAPKLALAARAEEEHATTLAAAEHSLQQWQTRWEEFNRALGAAQQTTQVERARIEQLENQERRLGAQVQRLAEADSSNVELDVYARSVVQHTADSVTQDIIWLDRLIAAERTATGPVPVPVHEGDIR